MFSLEVGSVGTAMASISSAVGSEQGSQAAWCISLGVGGVSWAQEASVFSNGVLRDQLHARDDVALHEGTQVSEEWLALVLGVELICELWPREFAHLQLRNGETVLVDGIKDFSGLGVTVRFDHGKGTL